jgi:hypothetical protein
MDPAAIATSLLGTQMGQQQADLAMSMLRLNANAAKSMVNMLASAVQNATSLANVASGIGASVNLSA